MNAFVRLYDRLIAALRIVASGLVALMCILVLFDVTMRTLGVKIPAFSITVVEYSLLYLAMSAAPWLVRERGHVYIDLILRALPAAARRMIERIIYSVSIVGCLIVTATASYLTWVAVNSDRMDVRGIDVPLWVSQIPLPVGFFLVAMELLRLWLRGESYFDRGSEGRGAT
jgi:C4-dicarboxylate transporter, DctQ subunit